MITTLSDLFAGDESCHDRLLDRLASQAVTGQQARSGASPPGTDAWRMLLQHMPLDKRSFNDIYAPRDLDAFISGLGQWCMARRSADRSAHPSRDRVFGFLGLLLITWLGLMESDERRNLTADGAPGRQASHDCTALCRPLIADPRVQQAIQAIYSPEDNQGKDTAVKTWEMVDFGTLGFHRHGTTSLILSARGGIHERVALKLILLPFLRIRSIGRETSEYYTKYGGGQDSPSEIVGVWASTGCWILMDFVDGLTLRELLDRPRLLCARLADPQPDLSTTLRRTIVALARERPKQASGINEASLSGASLDELLDRYDEVADPPERTQLPEADLIWMRDFGKALFGALASLQALSGPGDSPATEQAAATRSSSPAVRTATSGSHQGGRPPVHGDLTPSNIMVRDVAGMSLTLIDLGRNYLYTQSMRGTGGADSAFVSPEVRLDAADLSMADVYSLGELLICVGAGGTVQPRPVVPDLFYSKAPYIARFLEDLIQEAPQQRLTVFRAMLPERGSNWSYGDLEQVFLEELEAVEAAEGCKLVMREAGWRSVAADLFRPMKGAPWQQYRLWKVRRKQVIYRAHGSGTRARGLFIWSWVSLVAGAIGFVVVVTWFWRDVGWGWSGHFLEATQKATGSGPNQFPFLDQLRVAGYHVPDLKANWPARAVGLSFVLLGARYYQVLFAGLSPSAGARYWKAGWRAIASEGLMRLETVTAMVLVLIGNLVNTWAWPILTAIGQTLALLCNWAALVYVQQSLAQARDRNISTVPRNDMTMTGYALFKSWLPGSLFYAAVVWLIGLLIYFEFLHDIPVYAISVVAINMFLYLVKCGINAPQIRVCLTRACLAAERLRVSPHKPT